MSGSNPYKYGVQTVDVSDVRPNPIKLRDVNKDTEEYRGLKASIHQKGFIGTISARPKQDENGKWYLESIDGLHRLTAVRDLGISEISVDVKDMTDEQVLQAQLMLNIHKIDTKPVEYSQQLRRMMDLDSMLTVAGLAEKLGVSPAFIEQRLSLNNIENQEILNLIREGTIKLSNAFALAKLPEDEMLNWIERAMTDDVAAFVPAANARAKEIKEAQRKGKDAPKAEWSPTAVLRKIGPIKDELGLLPDGPTANTGQARKRLIESGMTPIDAATALLMWVIGLDKDSIHEQKTKHEQNVKAREESANRRNADKAAKKKISAERQYEEAGFESDLATRLANHEVTPEEAKAERLAFKAEMDEKYPQPVEAKAEVAELATA